MIFVIYLFYYYCGGRSGEEETPFLVCASLLSFTRLLSAFSQWRVRAREQQALGSVIDGQARLSHSHSAAAALRSAGLPAAHRPRLRGVPGAPSCVCVRLCV